MNRTTWPNFAGAATRRTYSHLGGARRMPTEYELVTTGLHYGARYGFEVRVPIAAWYERYGAGARLACGDWERFRDPRETTYAKYTSLQQQKESFVDRILHSIDELAYDARLDAGWRATLARVFAPSRYLFHGMQMIAAYAGQMAPSGRITIACAFQAADEMRRIQRVAYRMRQMQCTHPDFGEGSRATWQSDAAWQPAREAVERLLVEYDWTEALFASNLVLKPILDDLLMARLASLAWQAGDPLLSEILRSLDEDCSWHRAWSVALFQMLVEDRPENRDVMQASLERWHPLARRAAMALSAALPGDGAAIADPCAAHAAALGLKLPAEEAMP